ncbi:MAG: helix-turn-helix transcriptional regulator [Clostridiales bacterium]|nr:helix-turn-helix transcriptional regulator [Clostridiales bacterium]
MSIGDNLRSLRLNRNMTQEQAAQRLGVARQTVSSYESGRTRPDIEMLTRFCELYGTDLDGIVYGRARVLKTLNRLKRTAVVLFALLVGMTFLGSALLWSANRFFPVEQGQLTRAELGVFEAHRRLTASWETVDWVILAVSLTGFLALFLLVLTGKCRVPARQKLIYMVALAAGLLLAALPFAATDPVFPAVNYLITPIHVIARMVLFCAVLSVTERVRERKSGDGGTKAGTP